MCGHCGTRLNDGEAEVDPMNRDPAGAIRMLIGPGFATPQPHTEDTELEELEPLRTPVKTVKKKKLIRKKGAVKKRRTRPSVDLGDHRDRRVLGDLPQNQSRQGQMGHPHPGSQPVEAQFKVCVSCGTRMRVQDQFCGKCGNPLPTPGPVIPNCQRCGTRGSEGQRFCGQCGCPF